jgi:Ras-related protein Rab-8A
VGKTCLLLRYAEDAFSPRFITTIGIDFKLKMVNIDGYIIKLQIWDTAGQERFRTITVSYFKGAQAMMLVYDITERKTFDNISGWMSQINEYADENVQLILIGNKCESPDRKVESDEGQTLASSIGCPFVEVSAKENINVTHAFQIVAKETRAK